MSSVSLTVIGTKTCPPSGMGQVLLIASGAELLAAEAVKE